MKKRFFGMMCLVLLVGCASMMAKPEFTQYTTKTFTPKTSVDDVEIYSTPPRKDYIELGMITCKDTSKKWNLQQVKTKAKDVGADAIIISHNESLTTAEIIAGVERECGIKAIAIKYQ